jgi:hypothetical protein
MGEFLGWVHTGMKAAKQWRGEELPSHPGFLKGFGDVHHFLGPMGLGVAAKHELTGFGP